MKKYDSLLKKVEFFEKLALYGDRSAFLRAFAQQSASPGQSLAPASPAGPVSSQGPQTQTLKETTIYSPISKAVQHALNELVGTKLELDGELGPQTRAALNKFQTQFNQPPTPQAVAMVYQQHKTNPSTTEEIRDISTSNRTTPGPKLT